MTPAPPYVVGAVGGSDVPQAVVDQTQTQGWRSAGEVGSVQVLTCWNGRLRCGVTTDDLTSDGYVFSALYAVPGIDGIFGAGNLAVTTTNSGWTFATRRLSGSFSTWTFYEGAYITLTSNDGSFTSGERYAVESRDPAGAYIVLKNQVSLDNGVAFPGTDQTGVDFTVSVPTFMAMYCPLIGPPGTAGQDNAPAVSHSALHRSGFWTYPMYTIPPGGGANGALIECRVAVKVKLDNVALRPSAQANFYLTLDPFGSELVIDNRQNEAAVGRESPAINGWTVDNPYTAGVISNVNGKVLVTLPNHGYSTGNVVIATSSTEVTVDGDDFMPDLEDGKAYFVVQSDMDTDVTDDVNSFMLSRSNPQGDPGNAVAYDPVLHSGVGGESTEVVISQPSAGSVFRKDFLFRFTASQETDLNDYQHGTLEWWEHFDGRTAQTQEGVFVSALLTLLPNAEKARNASTNHVEPITAAPLLAWGAVLPRTTPGNSITSSGSDEAMTAARMVRVKTTYYTDSAGPTNFHAYQTTLWDYSGAYDIVHLDRRPHNEIIYTGGAVAFSAATWNATNRTIQKAAAFNSYQFRPGDLVRITGGTGWTAGYYEVEAKEASNRIRLVAGQAGMAASNNTDTNGDIDDYPLVAILSEEATGQSGNPAICTEVYRSGVKIGEVVNYSNIRQFLHVRHWGTHVEYGDTLELRVHRREKDGGTGSWGFNCNTTTPIRTYTVVARTVEIGPHPTYMQARIAMDGPPNSDCVVEARAATVTLTKGPQAQ